MGLVRERDEVHREPGAHRLARLRVAQHDARTVGDAVDRPLAAGRELHHEQVRPALVRQQLDRLLQAHRHRAGALVQELVRAIDGGVEHAKAARPGREHGLEAHRAVGVAELARGGVDLGGAVDPPELGRRRADPMEEGVRLGLVVRPVDRVRVRHEDGDGEALAVRCESLEIEGGLGQDDVDAFLLDDPQDRVGEAWVGSRGDEMERVAEVPSNRALGHVRTDESHVALAVLAQRPHERRRSGRAGCGDENGRGPQGHVRSILSSESCSSRRARSASSSARIVSPMVDPG